MATYPTLEQTKTMIQSALNIVYAKEYEQKENLHALAYKDEVGEGELSAELVEKINSSYAGANLNFDIVPVAADEGFVSAYQLAKITGTGADANTEYVGAKINIPKSILVQTVSDVLEATAADPEHGLAVGDKYVVFTIEVTDGTTSRLYLKLTDLVDVYKGGIGIVLGEGNSFALKINATKANGLAVDENGLKLENAIASTDGVGGAAGAMSARDKEKLDGLANFTHPAYSPLTGVETSNATPAFGETFSISQVVTDGLGSVTSLTSRTVKIPNAIAVASEEGEGGSAGLMSAADKEKLDSIEFATDEDIDDLIGELTL